MTFCFKVARRSGTSADEFGNTLGRATVARWKSGLFPKPVLQVRSCQAFQDRTAFCGRHLQDICPTAAAAYSQAFEGLRAETRESWRGPATDLRESLRGTLDILAPDADAMAPPGFKLEKDAHRPTMRGHHRCDCRVY
jgi:hypothetical protein